MKPRPGRIVMVELTENINGDKVFPAIVVQSFGSGERINCSIFLPGGEIRAGWSVASKALREQYASDEPFWFWPEREPTPLPQQTREAPPLYTPQAADECASSSSDPPPWR